MSVDAIAGERGISPKTVYQHAAQLIKDGHINLEQAVPLDQEDIDIVERCLLDHDLTEEGRKLKPVYEALAEVYSYESLRCIYMNFLRKLSLSS